VTENHVIFFSHVNDLNLTDSLIYNLIGSNTQIGDIRIIMFDSILPRSDPKKINNVLIKNLTYDNS
jgi:hypothetical protein